MAYIGNSPDQTTVLRVEARKSFALSLWFMDRTRRPADLTGATVTLVVKQLPLDPADTGDANNLITSSVAIIDDPLTGYCRFDVQAAELNLAPAEYPYAVVLRSAAGYSQVVVKGVLDVVQNTEFASMAFAYDDAPTLSALEIRLLGQNEIEVLVGSVVPPGFAWMSDADKAKLDGLELAGNLLPAGGDTRMVLAKNSPADYDFTWQEPQSFDGTLSAAGISTDRAPVSNGAGGWSWLRVPSRTTPGQTGYVPVANADGTWYWNKSPYGTPDGILAGANLDTYVTTGVFHNGSNANALPELNYPIAYAGLLEVHHIGTTFIYQRYTTYGSTGAGGRTMFSRAKYSSNPWTAWREYSYVGHQHPAADIVSGELDAARVPKVIDLRGISRGTADPTGGEDGDLYLKVLP